MNIAKPTGTAGCIHRMEFFIAKIATKIPAMPKEIDIVIIAQIIRPTAPLWSPSSRLILSDSTHSNSNTAPTRNTSRDITGSTQDNSSLNVGESWILSIPISEVSNLEINNSRTIPSNTEGILKPKSLLTSRDIPSRITRAPSKTRISHWCSSATFESPSLPAT